MLCIEGRTINSMSPSATIIERSPKKRKREDTKENGGNEVCRKKTAREAKKKMGGADNRKCSSPPEVWVLVQPHHLHHKMVRQCPSKFSSNYKITIGADFSIKSLQWDKNTKVNIQLWDIAGHERFGYLTRVYYKYAMAAAVVFDLSRLATFQSIEKWLTDLRDKVTLYDGSPIPVILLANKCDIHGSNIQHETIARFCKERDIATWFLTSAKENINIGEFCSQIYHKRLVLEAIAYLVEKVIHIKRKERSSDAFFLRRSAHQEDVQAPMRSCCN
uniref:Ras-related protein Rab n=1 Tax=Timema cristinae TaxID=61476 RepID=A0A7R9CHF0_TIMCR|nr:unnamed protein product [Timema cristinae]